jgi:hypothetical protein
MRKDERKEKEKKKVKNLTIQKRTKKNIAEIVNIELEFPKICCKLPACKSQTVSFIKQEKKQEGEGEKAKQKTVQGDVECKG